jgi:hypothetical protein
MDKMNVKQLKQLAKSKGIKGFSTMRKNELISIINKAEQYLSVKNLDNLKSKSSDITNMKLTDLRLQAKSKGIKGYSSMKKPELINLLNQDKMRELKRQEKLKDLDLKESKTETKSKPVLLELIEKSIPIGIPVPSKKQSKRTRNLFDAIENDPSILDNIKPIKFTERDAEKMYKMWGIPNLLKK